MTIGSNIAHVLEQQLIYRDPVVAVSEATVLNIIIPSVLGVVVVVVCVMITVFVCFYRNSQRKSVSIAMHDQIVELVATRYINSSSIVFLTISILQENSRSGGNRWQYCTR